MADTKDTPEKKNASLTPETAAVKENAEAANTSTPQVEPPDEHSPDPIMTRE